MPVTVRIDAGRFSRTLTGPGSAGELLLRRKAEQVAVLARRYAAGHGSIPEGIVVGPVVHKSVKVISTNVHSLYVHNGTRPHIIRPRRSRALRFVVGGEVVFARVVHHPGYRGDDFLTRALRDAT